MILKLYIIVILTLNLTFVCVITALRLAAAARTRISPTPALIARLVVLGRFGRDPGARCSSSV